MAELAGQAARPAAPLASYLVDLAESRRWMLWGRTGGRWNCSTGICSSIFRYTPVPSGNRHNPELKIRDYYGPRSPCHQQHTSYSPHPLTCRS
jgi:hypothetical protein